jgi:hypothetical protein
MITAKEAKELYDASGAEVDQYIQYKLDKAIRDAATQGKQSLFHFVDGFEVWKNVDPTPLQKRIIAKLKELGFHAVWHRDTTHVYVPAGLADDNGDGPKYSNYGIQIGW